MSFLVNIGRAVVGLLAFAVFLVIGIAFLVVAMWIPAVVCFALAVVFFIFMAFPYICNIRISNTRIERRFLWISIRQYSWEEIKEVGVVGLRLFGMNKKRVGAKYIYFSPEKMDEDERFQMCLKWPPRKVLYMRFASKRLLVVRSYWDSGLSQYNIGDMEL